MDPFGDGISSKSQSRLMVRSASTVIKLFLCLMIFHSLVTSFFLQPYLANILYIYIYIQKKQVFGETIKHPVGNHNLVATKITNPKRWLAKLLTPQRCKLGKNTSGRVATFLGMFSKNRRSKT